MDTTIALTMDLTMDEVVAVLSRRKTLEDIRIDRLHAATISRVMAFDVPTLRRMWDEINDDDSFYHGAEGDFDCADIHRALNLKGDGIYCAV